MIVGVDGSVPGLAALRFAAGEARRRGVPLYAVRAQNDLAIGDYTEIDAAFTEAFGSSVGDVEVHKELVLGSSATAQTRRADRAGGVLIVGTGRRDWWHAFWTGSVSRTCLHNADCQVLIVTGTEPARTARRRRQRRATWRGLEEQALTARD